VNPSIPALLALCPPWLVALPIAVVARVVATNELSFVSAPASGPLLGTVEDGGAARPAWDLGRLLGLPDAEQTWILLAGPLPLALRVGRCLSVAALQQPLAIPPALLARRHGLGCFVPPTLPALQPYLPGLAPVGLWLDPTRLLTADDLAAGRRLVDSATLLVRA
jgi:hypothetical protein